MTNEDKRFALEVGAIKSKKDDAALPKPPVPPKKPPEPPQAGEPLEPPAPPMPPPTSSDETPLPPQSPQPIAKSQKKKIFVVDDNEEIRTLYEDVLKNNGFEVVAVPDGLEALRKMKAGNIPDLLFTGILMSTLGGFDLIREMRKDGRLSQIPVVINSHRGRPEDKKTAEELGAKDFVVFGFISPIEVVERIKAVLGTQDKFKVVVPLDRGDAKNFINLLKKEQHVELPENAKEAELEIKELEGGEFSIRLIHE